MSELGTYITNEYGILKQIFSYLTSKDLLSASNVCREWKEVANRILMKNNKPVSYSKDLVSGWGTFHSKLHPKVVLHFSCSYGRKNLGSDFFPKLSELYDVRDVSVFNIRNNYFIASEYTGGKLAIKPKLGKNAETALFLCDMPGVVINSFYFRGPLTSQEIETLDRLSDTKCLILIAGGDVPCINLAHNVTSIFNKDGSLLMAGGIAQRAVRTHPLLPSSATKYAVLGLTFHGENLTAHLGLHQLSRNLQNFMEAFSKEVGPLPEGSVRIAFMFSCINRIKMLKDKETLIFSKCFPNVPVYGFWSYGEFAVIRKKPSEPSPSKKAKLTDWLDRKSVV